MQLHPSVRSIIHSIGLSLPLLLAPQIAQADLDVAFVLDTTGSMSGELREVKERVTQIAEALSASRPDERVRLAVVAFRDRGDAYVTQVSSLSEDVKETFDFLSSLSAGGGGDGPEDVLSGLAVALDQLSWGPGEHQIFLIGDAPPHLDYEDHVEPEALIERARAKRVVINAVGCRSLSKTGRRFFRRMAYRTEGRYQHIGGVRAEAQLTKAVLSTLTQDKSRSAGSPVDLVPLSNEPPQKADLGGIRAFVVSDDAGCRLEVGLPTGLDVEGLPKAEMTEDRLSLQLLVTPGMGRHLVYALSSCPDQTVVVDVDFGGVR